METKIKRINLFIFFDYVYYVIAYQYYKWYSEETNEFSGILVLSLIQLINIISVLFFLKNTPLSIVNNNPVYSFLIGGALLLLINGIRYKKIITYAELHKKWGNDYSKTNIFKKSLVFFYIFMTIPIYIISVAW